MLAPTRNRIDYADLVRDDRVHGSVYYDPDIFADELEKNLVPAVGVHRPRE